MALKWLVNYFSFFDEIPPFVDSIRAMKIKTVWLSAISAIPTISDVNVGITLLKIKIVWLLAISAIPTISDVNVGITLLKMLPMTFLKVEQKIDKISYWKLSVCRVMFYLAGFLDGAMADLRFLKEILGVCSSSDYDFPQQINVLKTFGFIYSGTRQVTFSDNSCQ